MKDKYQDRKQGREKVISGWFQTHVVENFELYPLKSDRLLETLTWKKRGTNINRIDYTRRSNVLMVTGDLGDAIYSWSEAQTLRWISGLDLEYFAGKCQASEVGRKYKEWNRELAEEWLKDYFMEAIDEEDGKRLAEEKRKAEDSYVWGSLSSEAEWIAWMMANGHDVFGDDLGGFENIGNEIATRCQAHLVGLRMAFELIDGVSVKQEDKEEK